MKLLDSIKYISNGTMANLTGLKEYEDLEIISSAFYEFAKGLDQAMLWQDAWNEFKESEHCNTASIIIKDRGIRKFASEKGIKEEGKIRLLKALVEITGSIDSAYEVYEKNLMDYHILGVNSWQQLVGVLLEIQKSVGKDFLPRLEETLKSDPLDCVKYLISQNWIQTQGVAVCIDKKYYSAEYKNHIREFMEKKI